MSVTADSLRPASYVPRRYASGTFPVSKDYNLRQMLYNYSPSGSSADNNKDINGYLSSHQVIPSLPFSDVPVYADTVDLETLGFHRVWGCFLTPDNVAASIVTNDVRYHVWVATKRVIESGLFNLGDREALKDAVMDQFMVELGLVLVDVHKGPLIIFVDPRLHDNSKKMVARAMAMLPATAEGIYAARELQMRHGVQINLSLVSCVEQAAACIEAGASMITMKVRAIMSWFEAESNDIQPGSVSRNHPGIQTIQSCADFIRHRGINTTLLTTDIRQLDDLKPLDGVGSTALTKELLDQMTMQHMVTWYPQPDGTSPAMLHALQGALPDALPRLERELSVVFPR
ncbi:hypothetical protein JVU11DRAFT_9782 [Chiua virens]|nr:hypothetical protein JVU11DRAFT_9782 [Chiua virens]